MNETLKRSLSGFVYVLLLICAITYSKETFLALFGIFLFIATVEFCNLIKIPKIIPLVLSAACFSFNCYLSINKIVYHRNFDLALLAATLLVSIVCLRFIFNSKIQTVSSLFKILYLIGYIIFPFIIITKIPLGANGYNPKILISIFILIWTNDTFAYIVGKSVGKNKLFKSISPKKTIEGFIGGVLFAIFAGFLLSKYYFVPADQYAQKSIFIWTITALIVGIFGTLGDLVESKFKRIALVKDSGKIMPGHGGILDRLDSIIFAAPFVYLFHQILNYVTFS